VKGLRGDESERGNKSIGEGDRTGGALDFKRRANEIGKGVIYSLSH